MNRTAIILAAGNGTRMGTKRSKLLLKIGGTTVIERSVAAFEKSGLFNEIIIVCRERELSVYKKLFAEKAFHYVIGGATRQQSVRNALKSVENAEYVAIHDGARPLIKPKHIFTVMQAAERWGAAAVGVPVKDTVKVIDSDGFVVKTPERSSLFAVQTPQAFRMEEFRRALEDAEARQLDFTDDCQLIEYAGGSVKMIQGDYANIKITTPEDVAVAEKLLLSED